MYVLKQYQNQSLFHLTRFLLHLDQPETLGVLIFDFMGLIQMSGLEIPIMPARSLDFPIIKRAAYCSSVTKAFKVSVAQSKSCQKFVLHHITVLHCRLTDRK